MKNFSKRTTIQGRAVLRVRDRATDRVVSEIAGKNLIFDSALNAFANGASGFSAVFLTCKVGSGNSPNSYANNAITFTQSGTTLTASGGFFAANMVGGIFKYGSGSAGVEQYIASYNSPTSVTLATALTVASPTTGTVWQVQQTALETFSYLSNIYASGGTVFSGNVATMTRVFNFANQAGTYSVNEVGYASNSTNDGSCNGRIVLPSTVSVAPSQYLQVEWQLTFTWTPAAPLSVANVGTNIDTTGTVMAQVWDCEIVESSGNPGDSQGSYPSFLFDKAQNFSAGIAVTPVSLNSQISGGASAGAFVAYILGSGSISNSGQPVGVGVAVINFDITTAGENFASLIFGSEIVSNQMKVIFVLNFATPPVLPTGAFIGSLTFTNIFGRVLTNL
jgi:hypothetical protein